MKLGRWLGLGVGATGALAAANAAIALRAGPVRHDLPGAGRFWSSPAGDVFSKVAGQGEPLLLVHGIHAAASAYEMRKIMPALAAEREVHALDLLGFGLSERPARRYAPELYIELLAGYLREVVGRPADIIASSLSAAYAIAVADRYPELTRRLTLICPTGLEQRNSGPNPAQRLLRLAFAAPTLGPALFNGLASRASIRYYLTRRTYFNDDYVTPEMIDAYYDTAHQPGARWAPAAFVCGELDHDVHAAWARLTQPVLIVWGRQARLAPAAHADAFIRLRPTAKLSIFERAGMLPHDEHAAAFVQLARAHLNGEEAS
jgi:pimeloyl-ACP methyl ester carboxylesterase